MEFSNEQKLIIALLTEIHSKLDIRDGLDAEFVQKSVRDNQGWALGWRYPGLFEETDEDPHQVQFVADVLDMWSVLETSYAALDKADRNLLAKSADPFGKNVIFPGFDGNNESEYLSIARTFVDDLDRWSEFNGRIVNAHMRTVESYQRMLAVFEVIRKQKMSNGDYGSFDVEELSKVLSERTHPTHR